MDIKADYGGVERFIEADEFFSLALSTRKLFRADQGPQGLRGLLDPETGDCFLIQEDRLMDADCLAR